jgi:hypothetical protein
VVYEAEVDPVGREVGIFVPGVLEVAEVHLVAMVVAYGFGAGLRKLGLDLKAAT